MTRYHPLLVALHWILAVLVIGGLLIGGLSLSETPNADPSKLFALRMHMGSGILIGVLIVLRLLTRIATEKPPAVDTGNALIDRAGVATHWLFYILVIAMVGSGMALSFQAGLPDIVFGGSGTPLPEDFRAYPPRAAHGFIASLLGLLILLHVVAFAWHQWIRGDRLFQRMWFGPRRD